MELNQLPRDLSYNRQNIPHNNSASMALIQRPASVPTGALLDRFRAVRDFTTTLCEPLTPEDACIQAAPFASPTRWHLAHTSWFFETFLLKSAPGYRLFNPHYEILFNSYYNTVGEQFPRARRGLLSRPSLAEIYDYRRHVDDAVAKSFQSGRIDDDPALSNIIEWGIQHEQQHQELILTDIKYLFSLNPLMPAYRKLAHWAESSDKAVRVPAACGVPLLASPAVRSGYPATTSDDWLDFPEGLYEIGHPAPRGLAHFAQSSEQNVPVPLSTLAPSFAYDNESPRHRVFLEAFQLAARPVTSGEFLNFIEDGGYRRPELWLSDGWNFINAERLTHPLYWFQHDARWHEFTLAGPRPLDTSAPVCHLSYYEADAYARWVGARLPTEAEWEVAAANNPIEGNFVDALLAHNAPIHPRRDAACHAHVRVGMSDDGRHARVRADMSPSTPPRFFGEVWQWTASAYLPYPGYQPPSGALGEYNGKFMSGQFVLRGGSCATPSTHIRPTYRNFFPPESRWQFTGLRLAR
jgi:ergothioneine biosynthesis protein EgtB